MARLALGEALTNLVFARVTALRDIKASGERSAARSRCMRRSNVCCCGRTGSAVCSPFKAEESSGGGRQVSAQPARWRSAGWLPA